MTKNNVIELSKVKNISEQIRFITTKLRNINTQNWEFRDYLSKLGELTGIFLLQYFQARNKKITTGNKAQYTGTVFTPKECCLIAILRTGEPFRQGIDKTLRIFGIKPKNLYAAAKRIKKKNQKQWKFSYKLPYMNDPGQEKICIIADPMLATGGTFIAVIKKLKLLNRLPKKLVLVSCIASQYGIDTLNTYLSRQNIDYHIITAEIDNKGICGSGLDKKGYIVPGLGDAGDRSHD